MKKHSQPDARLRARRLATRKDDGLDSAPLRELLQRFMATEEALATLGSDSPDVLAETTPGPALDDTTEMIRRQQGALVRELRRRRAASRLLGGDSRRAPSAAWPPPPW